MGEIIGNLDPEITCSQFAIGAEHYFIDETFRQLVASGAYLELDWNTKPKPGDLLFYGDPFGNPSHVAKVDEAGNLVSKFTHDPNVYIHEMWEDPIPENFSFETCIILRSLIK